MRQLLTTGTAAIALVLALSACGGLPAPVPTAGTPSSSGSPSAPTPTPTSTESAELPDAEAALIAPRIGLGCNDLLTATQREAFLGVDDEDVSAMTYPLADGSAAELQAGVLTCQWAGPVLDAESSAAIDIKVLPDAATEFAAFTAPLAGGETLGRLGPGSVVNCFEYSGVRSCYLHFLTGGYWVDASYSGRVPSPAGVPDDAAVAFAGLIADALAASGGLAPAFVAPAGSLAAWSSCGVLDNGGGIRAAVSSPSLTEPEAEFTGDGTLFSEAWQRVKFKSCAWRHVDVYSSPPGQIRMMTVHILPGGGWAWADLRATAVGNGATAITIAGADDAVILCYTDDNCNIDVLFRDSFLSIGVSVEQYRGGAPALTELAAEYAIARL